ncbi:hypothetical protein DB345_21155 [Spartobacteria bacterium LR76]|nr:hypothetical protein DB345_21155 [Spartobacteria bacterium LR76]
MYGASTRKSAMKVQGLFRIILLILVAVFAQKGFASNLVGPTFRSLSGDNVCEPPDGDDDGGGGQG